MGRLARANCSFLFEKKFFDFWLNFLKRSLYNNSVKQITQFSGELCHIIGVIFLLSYGTGGY